jgi:hypothetical protein
MQNLSKVTLLEHVQKTRGPGFGEGHGADFRQPVMIQQLGSRPGTLNLAAHLWQATAWLAGNDNFADGAARQIQTLSCGGRSEVQRVSGRATEHLDLLV